MTTNQIKEIQAKVGTAPDGFWGPKSIAACESYLRDLMPHPNPWPKTDQASLTKFYGQAGDESQLTVLNVDGLGVKYDGKPVKTMRCNKKIAESLYRILVVLSDDHPGVIAKYAGVYNNRNMRGGTNPSLHARGAAIDLWPEKNGNGDHWPKVALMPLEVMEVFANEGVLAAGAFWSRDAMHFQWTK